jgi:sphinganine C4-monooxygenase
MFTRQQSWRPPIKSVLQMTAMNPGCPSLHLKSTGYPFYYSPKARLVDGIPDHLLTLAAPVIAYWALSLFFHFLDISEWKWLNTYRIHDSEEVKSKNLVTKSQVVWAVIFQQIVQTALGLAALSDDSSHLVNHRLHLLRIATYVEHCIPWLSGSPIMLARATEFVYWWAIPALQFLGAMYVPLCKKLHFLTNVPKVRH